jgi:hypothetical protein
MPASDAGHDPERDELGLTLDDWWDLQVAYNYGTLEPRPGSVEEEAFRRMNEYARSEVLRVADDAAPAASAGPRRATDTGEPKGT